MTQNQDELPLFSQPATRHFLGWDLPLLTLATAYLAQNWQSGPLDLTHLAVLVPTRNASRRLREALALKAAERNTGCLPPTIFNPDDFLTDPTPPRPQASKLDLLLTWIQVLQKTRLSDFPHLFPTEPLDQGLSWALKTTNDFTNLQSLLGESARTASSVARQFANTHFEPERWAEFAQLEDETYRLLRSQGKEPRALCRLASLESFQLPPHCNKLLLIGIVDSPPALDQIITRLSNNIPTEILIHAPSSLASHFDALGRPNESWTKQHIAIPDDLIHPTSDPEEQTQIVLTRLSTHSQATGIAAIGVPDTTIIATLQKTLSDANLCTFDPGGKPLTSHGFCHLLRTLHDLLHSRSFLAWRELLRIPGIAEAAASFQIPKNSSPFPTHTLLIQFDRFHEHHLPISIDDAGNLLETLSPRLDKALLTRALAWLRHWLKTLESGPFAESLTAFLTEVYHHATHQPHEDFKPVIDLLHKQLDDFTHPTLQTLTASDRLSLFLSLLEEQTLTEKRPPLAIDLPGWLELPWEDAPHLIVTGFNDGLVPETIQAHPWLPDTARRKLGLRHNATRHARDAYLLAALHASRIAHGHLDLFFGRTNASGDPLRPSRLLFALPDVQLAARVNFLFNHHLPPPSPSPATFSWPLTPPTPHLETLTKLSVTAFADYLACPFRFYLKHLLNMREPQLDLMEMNAKSFGELTHLVLHQFAKSSAATSADPRLIKESFDDHLTDLLQNRFGSNRTLPLLVQEHTLRQRLHWWANLEANQRAQGWTILETETPLTPPDTPFLIGGLPIIGRIDRIERHPDDGIRVLDFKTSHNPTEPAKAHLSPPRSLHPIPDWQLAPHEKKSIIWINLQLPLYLLALQARFPNTPSTAGYINLPPTESETNILTWPQLTTDLLASAQHCAESVVSQIQSARFWPPNDKITYDDYRNIILNNHTQTINPVNLP